METATAQAAPEGQPEQIAPFHYQQTIKANQIGMADFPRYRRYAVVLNCLNWAKPEERPNWSVDVQWLKQHEYDPEGLELTTVKEYMIPAWKFEPSDIEWKPPFGGCHE